MVKGRFGPAPFYSVGVRGATVWIAEIVSVFRSHRGADWIV
jgi:hypothetical protein